MRPKLCKRIVARLKYVARAYTLESSMIFGIPQNVPFGKREIVFYSKSDQDFTIRIHQLAVFNRTYLITINRNRCSVQQSLSIVIKTVEQSVRNKNIVGFEIAKPNKKQAYPKNEEQGCFYFIRKFQNRNVFSKIHNICAAKQAYLDFIS